MSNHAASALAARAWGARAEREAPSMDRDAPVRGPATCGTPGFDPDAPRLDPEVPTALSQVEGRWQHRGTIGVRGPCAPAWSRLGLTDDAARALEFTAAWFGAPFDGVNLRAGRTLSWGFWHHSGAALAEVLGRFRGCASAAFESTLARHGIGVAVERGPGGAPRFALAVVGGGPAPRRGAAAAAAIASDRRLVAALARAARAEEARAAQVEVVLRRSVHPALEMPVAPRDGSPAATIGALLRTPRLLAVALVVELSGGLAGVRDLARALAGIDQRREPAEVAGAAEARLRSWVARMEEAGRVAEAGRVWRALGSPELEPARRIVLDARP